MIKGDVQVSENGNNLPAIPLGTDINTNFSKEETRIEISLTEQTTIKVDIKAHFGRLKRRLKGHSSGIL